MSCVALPLIVDAGTEPCDPSVRGSGPNVAKSAKGTKDSGGAGISFRG
jgi:hypothetical protein